MDKGKWSTSERNTKSGRPTELGLANVEGSKEREEGGEPKKKKREGKEERRATEGCIEDVGEGGVGSK